MPSVIVQRCLLKSHRADSGAIGGVVYSDASVEPKLHGRHVAYDPVRLPVHQNLHDGVGLMLGVR